MLVSYSDSEGSDDEQSQQRQTSKSTTQLTTSAGNSNLSSNFARDRSTGKIQVNISSLSASSSNINVNHSNTHEDEPASKRPRLGPSSGGGAFTNFNSLLPAPKRNNPPSASQNGSSTTKPHARKVFSLRTGAEPAFSRESDAEMREFFAEQNVGINTDGDEKQEIERDTTKVPIPKPAFAKPAPPAPVGKAFMFRPLSVARSTKKKAPTNRAVISNPRTDKSLARAADGNSTTHEPVSIPEPAKKEKLNLFSAGTDTAALTHQHDEVEEDEIIEDLGPIAPDDSLDTFQSSPSTNVQPSSADFQLQPQSLDFIAQDLKLSPAERRQLFGRTNRSNQLNNAINVVNFNTDAEYASNQQLIASGEQAQHNPVRAIASGKHSLRQLVTSAATQKDALEESFATGKRNKKEAGNKYGW